MELSCAALACILRVLRACAPAVSPTNSKRENPRAVEWYVLSFEPVVRKGRHAWGRGSGLRQVQVRVVADPHRHLAQMPPMTRGQASRVVT